MYDKKCLSCNDSHNNWCYHCYSPTSKCLTLPWPNTTTSMPPVEWTREEFPLICVICGIIICWVCCGHCQGCGHCPPSSPLHHLLWHGDDPLWWYFTQSQCLHTGRCTTIGTFWPLVKGKKLLTTALAGVTDHWPLTTAWPQLFDQSSSSVWLFKEWNRGFGTWDVVKFVWRQLHFGRLESLVFQDFSVWINLLEAPSGWN